MTKIEDKIKKRLELTKLSIGSIPTTVYDLLIEKNVDVQRNTYVIDDEDQNVNTKQFLDNKYSCETFYIKKNLLERLNEITVGEKGLKTEIVNEALKQYLDRI